MTNLQIQALQDLTLLHRRFKLTVTLDDYTVDAGTSGANDGEAANTLAQRILGRIALAHLGDCVRSFLYPKVFRQRSALVRACIQYIRFMVAQRRSIALWQERSVCLVQQLFNETDRLECALLVLKAAPVPWSAAVQPLVAYRTSGHPLAADIASQFELQAIKILKTKYGWPADAPDDPVKLACRICKLRLPEMFADIRAVHDMVPERVERCGILVTCVLQLIAGSGGSGKGGGGGVEQEAGVDRAVEFVDQLREAEAASCCESVLDILGGLLDDDGGETVRSDRPANDRAAARRAAYVEFLTACSARFLRCRRMRGQYERIRRLHTLRERFGMRVRMAELTTGGRGAGAELLAEGIERIIEGR